MSGLGRALACSGGAQGRGAKRSVHRLVAVWDDVRCTYVDERNHGGSFAARDRRLVRVQPRSSCVRSPGLPVPWDQPQVPSVWQKAKLLRDRSMLIWSFQPPPSEVNSGQHDSYLREWFRTAPDHQLVFWSYIHEPEDNIAARGVHRRRVSASVEADRGACQRSVQTEPVCHVDPHGLDHEAGPASMTTATTTRARNM